MLVLSRKKQEQIMIGDDVVITVIRITPHLVKLGIDAPPHIKVLRNEHIPQPNEQPHVPGSNHKKPRGGDDRRGGPHNRLS